MAIRRGATWTTTGTGIQVRMEALSGRPAAWARAGIRMDQVTGAITALAAIPGFQGIPGVGCHITVVHGTTTTASDGAGLPDRVDAGPYGTRMRQS